MEHFPKPLNMNAARFTSMPTVGQAVVILLFELPEVTEVFIQDHSIGVLIQSTTSWECELKILLAIRCALM